MTYLQSPLGLMCESENFTMLKLYRQKNQQCTTPTVIILGDIPNITPDVVIDGISILIPTIPLTSDVSLCRLLYSSLGRLGGLGIHLRKDYNQFQKFIDSQFTLDYDSQITDKYFVKYTRIETQVSKIDMGKAVDADLVVTKSSGIESEVKDDISRSGNDIDVDDAYIRPIYDEEPMTEVQLTAEL
ncbi:hypothetical protein Tco_0283004 [Tanacetum coccineum]